VVNVSSIWGAVGAASVAAYTASKGAVTQMTKNAALTYAGQKVRVNSVHPGLISTPMIDAQDQAISDTVIAATPLGRIGQPNEVANVILFLAGDEASYVTGAQDMVDGGYTTP
jgi:NAD(P)-dependent dehydrogenase (short-subunit alcohol dehydrogenase family)